MILGADNTRSNSVELSKKLGWLPFNDNVKISKWKLDLKHLLGNSPVYMYDLLNSDVMQISIHELVTIMT